MGYKITSHCWFRHTSQPHLTQHMICLCAWAGLLMLLKLLLWYVCLRAVTARQEWHGNDESECNCITVSLLRGSVLRWRIYIWQTRIYYNYADSYESLLWFQIGIHVIATPQSDLGEEVQHYFLVLIRLLQVRVSHWFGCSQTLAIWSKRYIDLVSWLLTV